ncbi:MAG TPA: cobaltochelatase subunit CobN, partial [Methanobacteriaceae archaeon]|nr:cobaltochelatase subunit CobN [Methanobacteriaceae archaeon]
MVSSGSIVIPGIVLGNVLITVQPSRGWEEVENYHDEYLPPHHQYIALYKWLEEAFNANVMIHMGTHGTMEWLPGRHVGLQEDDWPFQLSNIPNINPYIVSNPGEGLVAKDRANALIIDHMTPAMVRSGLYGDLIVMHDLIHQYQNALNVGNYQILPA